MFCYITSYFSHVLYWTSLSLCKIIQNSKKERENSPCLHVEGTNLPNLKEYLNIYAEQNSFCLKDRERLNSEHSPASGASFQNGVGKEFKALIPLTPQVVALTSTQPHSCASCRKTLSCLRTLCQERVCVTLTLREPPSLLLAFPSCWEQATALTSKTLPSTF